MAANHEEETLPDRKQSVSLWRNRDYLLLWSGQTISDIGGSVSELAFPLLVLAVTNSPVQAGIAAALRALPATLFSLLAGAFIDRWDRKRVMVTCDIGRALSLASIPIAILCGVLTIWQLYITAFLEGTLLIFFNLAQTASLAQIVSDGQLGAAVAQEEFMEGTTALFGPTLSGLLFTLSRVLPFVADAVSYAVSVCTLLFIRMPFQRQRSRASNHLRAEIGEGLTWLWRQPFIRAMTMLSGASALVIPGANLTIIVLAQQRGASPFVIGLIFAFGGVGSVLGALCTSVFQRWLRVGQSVLLVRWFFVLVWPFYALVPYPLLMGLVDFGVGFADPVEDVPYFSYRLSLIPDELRGRVISACRLFPSTMRPLGLALTGLLLQRIGAVPTLLLGWAGLLIMAVVISFSRSFREAGKQKV